MSTHPTWGHWGWIEGLRFPPFSRLTLNFTEKNQVIQLHVDALSQSSKQMLIYRATSVVYPGNHGNKSTSFSSNLRGRGSCSAAEAAGGPLALVTRSPALHHSMSCLVRIVVFAVQRGSAYTVWSRNRHHCWWKIWPGVVPEPASECFLCAEGATVVCQSCNDGQNRFCSRCDQFFHKRRDRVGHQREGLDSSSRYIGISYM